MAENVLLERPFFDTHAETLHDLFVVLGREQEWRDTPQELLPYTQTHWVGVEHGNSFEKDQFDPDQEAAALELMSDLGLQHEVPAPRGSYEQIVILGGMMRVNRERIDFMKTLLDEGEVQTGHVVFWAGQRLREARDDDQVAGMDLGGLSGDRWVRDELAKPTAGGWQSRFATETELARLAYLEAFHGAKLDKVALTVPRLDVPEVPGRGIVSYKFNADGYPEFTLMNCAAVSRPKGNPRPTTQSQSEEWLGAMTPPENARVLVVAGNPHIPRNGKQIGAVAAQRDRQDICLEFCGPGASPSATIQLYLGEIGRLLYMDAQTREAPGVRVALP